MLKIYKEMYQSDLNRYKKIPKYQRKLHKYFRKSQSCHQSALNIYYRFRFKLIKQRNGIEISYNTNIGKGFYIGHPYNITINEGAIIGENCNIHKGVVIGQENRGKRKGTPVIGDYVWIGINAAIVGHVHIGNDVLIAPNAYVNCDVPDHSIVFGNPCVIKHKEGATQGYINNDV